MAGTDTSRGINFQYASAIGILIEFPNHANWHIVQMEGDEDIEDVVVFDAQGKIVLRAQIKQKQDPYQWQPAEICDVVARLADCSNCTERTRYQFIYAGSEGKALAALKSTFAKLKAEGADALTQVDRDHIVTLLDAATLQYLDQLGSRLELDKESSRESVELRDLRKLRSMLVQHGSKRPEEGYEETLYKALFHAIAGKSEANVKYSRRLTRTEVFSLLEIEERYEERATFNSLEYVSWLRQNAATAGVIAELSLQPEQAVPEILSFALSLDNESRFTSSQQNSIAVSAGLSPWQVVQQYRQLMLVGDSGSGKTASLWQLALHYSNLLEESPNEGMIPIIINLLGYHGETIQQLIRQAFQMAGQTAAVAYVDELVAAGRVVLLLDAFDYIQSEHIYNAAAQIKQWSKLHAQCRIVVTTRRPSDGHLLELSTFRLRPLTDEQAKAILQGIPDIDEGDFVTIWHGQAQKYHHLVTTPLTLRMLVYTYLHAGKQLPPARGQLYQQVVNAMLALGEAKGVSRFDRSDKHVVLSTLARWMQQNEIYSIPASKLGSLLVEWANERSGPLQHLKDDNFTILRQEIVQSGVVRPSLNGEIEFVHPTFMAFFAACTIQSYDLPSLVDRYVWRASLLLWASLYDLRTTDALIDIVIHDKILLGQLINERSGMRSLQKRTTIEHQQYFEQFNRFFRLLISDFNVLLVGGPWSFLKQNKVRLNIARNDEVGYTLIWEAVQNETSDVLWVQTEDISKHINQSFSYPFPVCLIPATILSKYHPLELAYLWIVRAIFDLLHFSTTRGGLDSDALVDQHQLHPAIPLVTNRFMIYQQLASDFPAEIAAEMPFYATKPFDLVVEVHAYFSPPIICFALTRARADNSISLIPSIVNTENNQDALFEKDTDGEWQLRTEKIVNLGQVEVLTVTNLFELTSGSPSHWAHRELNTQLTQMLPGYPPSIW